MTSRPRGKRDARSSSDSARAPKSAPKRSGRKPSGKATQRPPRVSRPPSIGETTKKPAARAPRAAAPAKPAPAPRKPAPSKPAPARAAAPKPARTRSAPAGRQPSAPAPVPAPEPRSMPAAPATRPPAPSQPAPSQSAPSQPARFPQVGALVNQRPPAPPRDQPRPEQPAHVPQQYQQPRPQNQQPHQQQGRAPQPQSRPQQQQQMPPSRPPQQRPAQGYDQRFGGPASHGQPQQRHDRGGPQPYPPQHQQNRPPQQGRPPQGYEPRPGPAQNQRPPQQQQPYQQQPYAPQPHPQQGQGPRDQHGRPAQDRQGQRPQQHYPQQQQQQPQQQGHGRPSAPQGYAPAPQQHPQRIPQNQPPRPPQGQPQNFAPVAPSRQQSQPSAPAPSRSQPPQQFSQQPAPQPSAPQQQRPPQGPGPQRDRQRPVMPTQPGQPQNFAPVAKRPAPSAPAAPQPQRPSHPPQQSAPAQRPAPAREHVPVPPAPAPQPQPEAEAGAPAPSPAAPERAKMTFNQKAHDDIFDKQTRFADLGIAPEVLQGVTEAGFEFPTSIQARIIPLLLQGKDMLGQAKTGTGKTAAFGLPLLSHIQRGDALSAIVLVPTRELAIQVATDLTKLGRHTGLTVLPVYGGQNISTQADRLKRGPEIIVATPGRLMDMRERGYVRYDNIKVAILDEVDRMLDIGFRDDIRRILGACPPDRQTVFVSATLPPEVEALARSFARNAEKIVATTGSLTASLVKQYHLPVEPWDKKQLLLHLLTHESPALTIVFCRTKKTVDNLAEYLFRKGIDAHAIHGDMYQAKRNKVIEKLKSGSLSVLIASDLASRGLDVEGITHVINYDLPDDPDLYIHRIGRTARAGRDGIAWSLVTPEQGGLLTEIEMLINAEIPKLDYPDFTPGPLPPDVAAERARNASRRADGPKMINRYAVQPVVPVKPAATAAGAGQPAPALDPSKFPGGIIPSKLPDRRLGGKVRSARSMRNAPAAPAPDAPAPVVTTIAPDAAPSEPAPN